MLVRLISERAQLPERSCQALMASVGMVINNMARMANMILNQDS